jgi:hypothetical protein
MKAIYRLLLGSTLLGFSFVISFIVLFLVGFSVASPWILLPVMPLALILIFISAAIIHKARFDYDMVPTNSDFFMAKHFFEHLKEIFIEPLKRIYCFHFNSYEEEMKDEWSLQDQMEACDQSLADTDEFSDFYFDNYDSPYLKRGSISVHKMDVEEEVELPGFSCGF